MSTWAGDEPNDFERDATHVARKEHKCCACKEAIKPGHTYTKITLGFEGKVNEHKHCLRCRAMFDALQKKCLAASDGEECAALRLNCGHEYKEKWGEDPPPELAELAFLLPGEKPGALIQREVASV